MAFCSLWSFMTVMYFRQYSILCKDCTSEGGLGFKDLRALNSSFLAKQYWRLVKNQNSLFYKVFRGKYFRLGDVMTAKLGNNPSWAWHSLLEGKKIIEKGLIWRIGNGLNVRIFEDPWLPGEHPFKVPREVPQDLSVFLVSQLKLTTGSWNEELLHAIFPLDIANRMKSITLTNASDQVIWKFNKGGNYSVASRYKVAFSFFYPPIEVMLAFIRSKKLWNSI